jgi:hypothetical protein
MSGGHPDATQLSFIGDVDTQMAVFDQRTRVSSALLRSMPRGAMKRLPPAIAIPVIVLLSAALWLGLFHLVPLVLRYF